MIAARAMLLITAGRLLLAAFFIAGFVQKIVDPQAAQSLLADWSLPVALVWPAAVFNAIAAILLVLNIQVAAISFALALYCMITSVFHFIPDDPWQMSIFAKNWAIAGGLLAISGLAAGRPAN